MDDFVRNGMDNPLSPAEKRPSQKHLLEVSAAQQRQQELLHQQRRGSVSWKFIFIARACSRVRYRRPIFCPSVRLSTFMSMFDIYVKVSILINYKTKQPSNLA